MARKSTEQVLAELRMDQKRIERLSNNLYRSTRAKCNPLPLNSDLIEKDLMLDTPVV